METFTEKEVAAAMRRLGREFTKAESRVGQTNRAWMQWLIRFSQYDIPSMSAGDFINLQFELQVVHQFGPPVGEGRYRLIPIGGPSGKLAMELSRKKVESFRAWVRQTLEAILLKEEGETPLIPPVQLHFIYEKLEAPHWRLGEKYKDSVTPRYALLLLIARYADQVQRCPVCNTIFLAETGKQEYCSKRCQAKIAKRRYREKDPNYVPGRKRGRPRKQEQATTKKTATTKGTRTKGGKKDGAKKR
jgi:hypothetical protein